MKRREETDAYWRRVKGLPFPAKAKRESKRRITRLERRLAKKELT